MSVEVDEHDGSRVRGDGLFDEVVVYLQRVDVRFDENRCQSVFGDGKDGGDKGVCRHDDLVAFLQYTFIYIRA